MTTSTLPPLGQDARDRLRRIADELIPAGSGLPSGSEVGVHTDLVDQVARVRPDLIPPLLQGLEATGPNPGPAAVQRLMHESPELFEAVALVVAGGYLMSPRVGALLKYPFQEAKVVDPRDIVTVISDGLLDQVIERGPIYRLPPDAPDRHDGQPPTVPSTHPTGGTGS